MTQVSKVYFSLL